MKHQTKPRTQYDIRVHADGHGNWHAEVRNASVGHFYTADDRGIALAKRAGREAIMRELRQRGTGEPIRTKFEYSFVHASHTNPVTINRARFSVINVYEPKG